MIVKSGGQWIDVDFRPRDKLHIHWRLNRPAMGGELDRLKQARRLAAAIVGADTSNVPTVHCLRWPGSWWRKDEPRLCEIAAPSPDDEIDLDDALVRLEAAAPKTARGNGHDSSEANPAQWGELAGSIIAGKNLHDNLARLAAKYARSGTPIGAGINQTRALMHASAARADRPADWQDRLDDIPRAFDTAYAKFAETPPTSNRRQLETFDVGNEDGNIPPRQWLLGTTYCRGYLSGLISAGAGGKTTIRILQLLSAAANRSLSGEFVFAPCRAMIVCLEDDMDELRRRVRAAMLHHHVEPEDVKGRLILTTPRKLKIADIKDKAGTVAASDLYHALSAAIDDLETRHRLYRPGHQSPFPQRKRQSANRRLRVYPDRPRSREKRRDRPPVPRAQGRLRNRRRRQSRDAAQAHSRTPRASPKQLPACRKPKPPLWASTRPIGPSLVRLDNAKVNIAPPSREATWFRLAGVNLGNGTEAYPNGDNVQVAEPWTPKPLFGGLATVELNGVLRKLGAGMEDGRRYSLATPPRIARHGRPSRNSSPISPERNAGPSSPHGRKTNCSRSANTTIPCAMIAASASCQHS